MAVTYVNRGDSFIYNQQMGTRSIVEYTDGTYDDISLGGRPDKDTGVIEEDGQGQDEEEQQEGGEDPEPEPTPDPEPEPEPEPTPTPEPEPESEQDYKIITIESTCTSKIQKANSDYPERHVTASSSGFCLTKWHTNFELCINYARKNGLPLFYVWSNKNCSHCDKFVNSVKTGTFKDFMAKTKIIWCFVFSEDKGGARYSSLPYRFGEGHGGNSQGIGSSNIKKLKTYRPKKKSGLLAQYPFVGLYWYIPHFKKPVTVFDVIATGDEVDDAREGKTGAKYVKQWLEKRIKSFKKYYYDQTTATFTIPTEKL